MARFLITLLVLLSPYLGYAQDPKPLAKHVILISFDGFRPDLITNLGPKADTFNRMIREGASTLNARTDDDYTVTLPNHTCMITGSPVLGPDGHHVTDNTIVTRTVHDYAGRHVNSIFDVLHQNKRHGAMLASKLKFNIYEHSFPIDIVSLTDHDDLKTLEVFEKLAKKGLPDFIFMHFAGADYVGHAHTWSFTPGSEYLKEAVVLNQYLKRVLEAVGGNASLADSTVIIVTADHGGEGGGHSDVKNPRDYTIPFIIWGKPVAKGVDLYRINGDRRVDPASRRINNNQELQPIRNGDAANLALSLLGLPSVEGSTIGNKKPLKVKD